jgi:Fe-S cluster assembly protein SufD
MGAVGGHTEIKAAALCNDRQFIDFHTQLGHAAPDTTSEQQQRNILAGSSECIFRGRIRVDGIAQKTDAHQICRTLMLSDKSRMTAMPSLEITADDVKCAHGATVTDLDEVSQLQCVCI